MSPSLEVLERMGEWVRRAQGVHGFWNAFILKGRETSNLRVWVVRTRLAWSAADAAARLGLSLDAYKRMERNGEPIHPEALERFSGLSGTPLAWLQCRPEGAEQADLFGLPLGSAPLRPRTKD